MADRTDNSNASEKLAGTIQHIDSVYGGKVSDVALDAATVGQAASGYENLTPWETIKAFKVCTLICFAMAFSAATDGYQIG
jgi:hypothetical protein